MGHRPFNELRAKMSPERRAANAQRAKELLAEMPLHELRQARQITQETLARAMDVQQGEISKIEHRTDVYISTLRSYIQAAGGVLDIIARFPDGDVRIDQFAD